MSVINVLMPTAGGSVRQVPWDETFRPFTGATSWTNDLLKCPSYKAPTTSDKASAALDYVFKRSGSYGYNADGSGGGYGSLGLGSGGNSATRITIPKDFVPRSQVRVPSDMIALGDAPLAGGTFGHAGYITLDGRSMRYNSSPAVMLAATRKRHRDRFNVVFCDNHAEYLPRKMLFDLDPTRTRRFNRSYKPFLIAGWADVYQPQ